MISSGDTYNYDRSLQSQRDRTPFSKKHIMYAVDTNAGNYTNSVQFDLSAFANVSNGFLSLSEATLQIPVVITATVPTGVAGPANLDHFVGFKNGAWNIINSLSVNYDGVDVIQPNNFSNAFINYRVISSWSQEDLKNFGASSLYSPDSSNSWCWNDTDVADTTTAPGSRVLAGNGITNNFISNGYNASNITPTTAYKGDFFGNKGLLDRVCQMNLKPADGVAVATSASGVQSLTSIRDESNFRTELKNYSKTLNTGAVGFVQFWHVLCDIRLKDLSTFFENMPLVKGAYLKLNIGLNTGSVIVHSVNNLTAAKPALYSNNSDINFQYTCPIQVVSRNGVGAIAGEHVLISVGVVNSPATTAATFTSHQGLATSHALTSCRITLPICEMKPDDSVRYLENSLNKRVEWSDIYQTTIYNIPAGSNFSSMISNGAKDALGILLIPLINGSSTNGKMISPAAVVANVGTSFTPCISPFATEPATPSPLSISQFQVIHGSENILSPFISYSYEEWLYQVNETFKINGNQSTGLASGLYSQNDFENGMRYYWCSLFRGFEDDKMPKSITVQGVNNSKLSADYLCFIVSAKSFNVNCANGKVVV